MTEHERFKLRDLCESIYRKDHDVNHNQKSERPAAMAAEVNHQTANVARQSQDRDETAASCEPTIAIRRSAFNVARRLAEHAVDEIQAQLNDATQQRDDLARRLGAQQDLIDRLTGELGYRTRHVRDLQSAGKP